jgi:multiple sugar transport system permease protein
LFSLPDLYGKFADDKYNGNIQTIDALYNQTYAKASDIRVPQHVDMQQVARWNAFVSSLPQEYKVVGFCGTPGQYSPAPILDIYREFLRKKFRNNIHELDRVYLEEDTDFLSVFPPFERPQSRLYAPGQSVKERDWAEFKISLPPIDVTPVLCDALYSTYLQDEIYSNNIGDLNKAWGTNYESFTQIELSKRVPVQAAQALDWANFVRTRLPLRFVRHDVPFGESLYAVAQANVLPTGPALTKLSDQIRSANPKTLTVVSADAIWRAENGTGTQIPADQADWLYTVHNAAAIRESFLTRNYVFTLNYMLLHGQGVWNTLIYCAAAVLTALLVNPLCAYALSRFRLPWGQSVLLFVLATMAFPGEVSMIPNFLLLKQLNLLNTFWALVLPGAASGYSIFLLKGFFDSLPKELYEAGMIDGASEMTLFRKVTLPLSKPIFAVIALAAFSAAYGNFLFAMLLCQAQSHWTIMVWVYEFQALGAPQYVMMSALVLASLPMLIVFLFAQNTIMRGIILPSFK